MSDRDLDAMGFIRDPLWSHEERLEAQCLFQQRMMTRLQEERDHWHQQYDTLLALPESDRQEFARYQEIRALRAATDQQHRMLDQYYTAQIEAEMQETSDELLTALRELLIDFDALDKGNMGNALWSVGRARALIAKVPDRQDKQYTIVMLRQALRAITEYKTFVFMRDREELIGIIDELQMIARKTLEATS